MVGTSATKRPVSALVATVVDRISETYLGTAKLWQERLPSERIMAEELGVSRGTVRHALHVLADGGAVLNLPQSGWYSISAAYPAPRGPLLSLTQSASIRGARPKNRLLRAQIRRPRDQEVVGLRLEPDDNVLALDRTRVLGGLTMCVEHNVVALGRASGIQKTLEFGSSLYAALEKHGAKPVRSDLTAYAALAQDDAVYLGIEPSSPVLIEEEVVTGEHRQPLMLARAVWRADLYRFRATFTAVHGAPSAEPKINAGAEQKPGDVEGLPLD